MLIESGRATASEDAVAAEPARASEGKPASRESIAASGEPSRLVIENVVKPVIDSMVKPVIENLVQNMVKPIADMITQFQGVASEMARAMAPVTRQIAELGTKAAKAIAPLTEQIGKVAAGLAGVMKTVARMPGVERIGRCLFEALLQFLERMPGGEHLRPYVTAAYHYLYPVEHSARVRLVLRCCSASVPPARQSSATRLVSRTPGRTLRGPSTRPVPDQRLGGILLAA